MQSHKIALIESGINTGLGFIVSWVLTLYLIPYFFNVPAPAGTVTAMTLIYTLSSFIRGYGLRRFFNWWHHRGNHD